MGSKYFAEVGYGNTNWISTEIENGSSEYRLNELVIKKITSFYIRIWMGKRVLAIGMPFEFVVKSKMKSDFKIVFGISSC